MQFHGDLHKSGSELNHHTFCCRFCLKVHHFCLQNISLICLKSAYCKTSNRYLCKRIRFHNVQSKAKMMIFFSAHISSIHQRNCTSIHPSQFMLSEQGGFSNWSFVGLCHGCWIRLASIGPCLCRSTSHAPYNSPVHSRNSKFPLIHKSGRASWKSTSVAQRSRCRHVIITLSNFSFPQIYLFQFTLSSGEMATIHSNIRRMKEQGTACKNVLVPQLIKPLMITCGLMFFLR